jgi:hypothetical protein
MHKYADDTYLEVQASDVLSCGDAIDNVERWAEENNLLLNCTKSEEVTFVSPRSKRSIIISQLAVPGFTRIGTKDCWSHVELETLRHSARRQSPSRQCSGTLCSMYFEAPWNASQCNTNSLPGHRRSQAHLCVSSLVVIRQHGQSKPT